MSKGEETRLSICQAARRLMAKHGYQGTSMQRVADEVDLSQSAVMYHYPAKLDLFRGVLAIMTDENQELAAEREDPSLDGLQRLYNYFDVNYEWGVEAKYNAQIMTCLFQFATYDPDFRKLYTDVLTAARGKVAACVHAGVREGLFVTDDPDRDAQVLHDSLLGMILTSVTTATRSQHRLQTRAHFGHLIENLLQEECRATSSR